MVDLDLMEAQDHRRDLKEPAEGIIMVLVEVTVTQDLKEVVEGMKVVEVVVVDMVALGLMEAQDHQLDLD